MKKELTEEELLRRIIEYKKYKEITKTLKECAENNSKKYLKIRSNRIAKTKTRSNIHKRNDF